MYGISRRDRRLLAELDSDSRRPLSALARAAGMSQQLASYKLKAFIEKGLLTGFYTAVDYSRFGYHSFRVYFSVSYRSGSEFSNLVASVAGNPYVTEVSECGGRWDLAVTFIATNASRFNKNLRALMAANPSLKNYDVVTNVVSHDFGRKYLNPGGRTTGIITGGDRDPLLISGRDAGVLAELLADPRKPLLDVASSVGMSPKTVRAAISRMREADIIKGFRPVIDLQKIGHAKSRMFVKYHNLAPEREREIVAYCSRARNVVGLHKVLGTWDLEIDLETRPGTEFRAACMAIREGFQDIIKECEVVEFFSCCKKSLLTAEALRDAVPGMAAQ